MGRTGGMGGMGGMVLLAALALVAAASAAAQEHAGGAGVFGGGAVHQQDGPTGESPHTYDTAPGGTTIGWHAGAGMFLARVVSVEFEVSNTGLMTAREPSRYGMTFNEERRDRFFTGAARVHQIGASSR